MICLWSRCFGLRMNNIRARAEEIVREELYVVYNFERAWRRSRSFVIKNVVLGMGSLT